MQSDSTRTVLSLNSSTQGLSGIVLDPATGGLVYRGRIGYAERFGAKYGIGDGFIDHGGGEFTAPSLMLVEALITFLDEMAAEIGPQEMRRIGRIAGAGQQHGTAYLSHNAPAMLRNADPARPLHEQFTQGFFTRDQSPIWMDSTTGAQCRILTDRVRQAGLSLLEITGSVATERFSFPQILRFAMEHPDELAKTSHICLISSLIASCMLGAIAPMEPGDAGGMNLMDIQHRRWSTEVADAVSDLAPNVLSKLPPIVDSLSIAGTLSTYMAKRYGFSDDVLVLPFSGDNPDSLLGVGISGATTGDEANTVLSLGTSDTVFALTERKFDPTGAGCVMGAVTGGRTILLCLKNGSLARQNLRDRYFPGDADWSRFTAALASTSPGNDGQFMVPFFVAEIAPNTHNEPFVRYCGGLSENDGARCARAIVEGQFLNIALQLEKLDIRPKRIRVTGGASVNTAVLQIASDILGVPLEMMEQPGVKSSTDSVSLGGAIRAASTLGWPIAELTKRICIPKGELVTPRNTAAYRSLRERYAAILAEIA